MYTMVTADVVRFERRGLFGKEREVPVAHKRWLVDEHDSPEVIDTILAEADVFESEGYTVRTYFRPLKWYEFETLTNIGWADKEHCYGW